jgi:hypothetical protein
VIFILGIGYKCAAALGRFSTVRVVGRSFIAPPIATASCGRIPSKGKAWSTEHFRRFSYEDLVKRDKLNLDIFWLKDESLGDGDNLPPPHEIAAEIVENLEAALEQFRSVAAELGARGPVRSRDRGRSKRRDGASARTPGSHP